MEIRFLSDLEYAVSGLAVNEILKQRYCVFDLESTGIHHETDHITQVGAVIIENGIVQESQTFNSYVQPLKPIPEAVERFTGIYNTNVERAPRLNEVYSRFIDFMKDCVLVTQAGYEFDLPLLRTECKRFGLPMMNMCCLDTKALFSYLHPEIDYIISTDYLIKYYKVNDRDLKRHDALGDSILIGRIFLSILEEFQARNLHDIHFKEEVVVKRFQITPLA